MRLSCRAVKTLPGIFLICATASACVPLPNLGRARPRHQAAVGDVRGGDAGQHALAAGAGRLIMPEVVSVPLGGAAFLCQSLFGARPSPDALAIAFDARMRIQNPNEIPLPLATPARGDHRLSGRRQPDAGATCAAALPRRSGHLRRPGPGHRLPGVVARREISVGFRERGGRSDGVERAGGRRRPAAVVHGADRRARPARSRSSRASRCRPPRSCA